MKFFITAAILSVAVPFTLADFLPSLLNAAPTSSDVKERIAPPANATLYDVWYAEGRRVYQCNPELKGFLHWYNVQTQAFLYPTNGEQAPFDVAGKEVGQMSAAPLNPEHQEANPIDTTPVIYYYKDGSWLGTGRPLVTTTKEEGREERGDSVHLDDHLAAVSKSSTDGYLSHAKYIVRLGSIDGVVPPADDCTQKGMLVTKPFNAYYMFYTDAEGVNQLAEEKKEWERMVMEYTPEKLAAGEKKKMEAAESYIAAEQKKEEVAQEEAPMSVVQEEAPMSVVQEEAPMSVVQKEAANLKAPAAPESAM
ncbi:ADP-ribosylation factor protein 3 [Mucor velutinosus]|uniref:ADP-ribosylation factor protein 3 n=1 Tax=Mucor velutinosus TaxID=708070 RepID=A0AAN7DPN1_9FUNG|nr:ADP-ribosylation factor protein 3 [Mucor velutinosus]